MREKEPPKEPAARPATRAVKPEPIAERDLTGRKRATPRPTMGALEAEPSPPPRPKPPKKSAPARDPASKK